MEELNSLTLDVLHIQSSYFHCTLRTFRWLVLVLTLFLDVRQPRTILVFPDNQHESIHYLLHL